MAAPALLLVALFTLYPVGRAVYQSTRIESPIFPSPFVGLENYRDVLGGLYFREAAETTLWFALASVPLLIVLGVLVALLLNESFIGNAVLRVGMLLPWALPATVAALIWKWIFLDTWGALNAGLYDRDHRQLHRLADHAGSGADGRGGRLHLDPVADRHIHPGRAASDSRRAL